LFLVLAGAPQPSFAAECSPAGDLSAIGELLSGLERLLHALDSFFSPKPEPPPLESWEPMPEALPQVQEVVEALPLPEPDRGLSPSDAHVWQFYGTSLDCGPASALIISRLLGLESSNDAVDNEEAMAWTPDGSNGADAKAGLSAMRGLMGASATGTTSFSQISRGLSALGADSTRVDSETTSDLAERIEEGEEVVVLGRPNGNAWSNTSVGAIDHFVVLSDYDEETDTFTVNDPAYRESLEVPSDQVDAFRNQSSQGRLAMTVSDESP